MLAMFYIHDERAPSRLPLPQPLKISPGARQTEEVPTKPTGKVKRSPVSETPDPQATMLTRTEFLVTGLVPVETKQTDDCPICREPLINPVRTPCSHIYDHACIEEWLNSDEHNTCPTCRAELFTLPAQPTVTLAQVRRAHVAHALAASNLISREPSFDTFGSTEYNLSSLHRATAQATYYLNQQYNGERDFTTGPCLFHIDYLSPQFIAMANLLPPLAARMGAPCVAPPAVWREVCAALWQEIRAEAYKRRDALVMPALLLQRTQTALEAAARRRGEHVHERFFDEADGVFFKQLIEYLVRKAQHKYQEHLLELLARGRTRALRKEAREEPKMRSRCGMM